MNKSILVIDTPSSCSECIKRNEYNTICNIEVINAEMYIKKRHINCPLISIDIDELKLSKGHNFVYDTYKINGEEVSKRLYNTIKSAIDKLKDNGGNE